MLLVCRFSPDDEADFLVRARRAVGLLAAQPNCERVDLARAVEAPGQWVLVAVFASLTDYRRALSPFDVREHVVPFLSEASTADQAVFERNTTALPDGGWVEHPSILG
ncbi:antibiotic biosynthesis monooxygenase family protein [Actinomycetospora termitidis]|uniref:Antibiotic biosynthesis monooxygenase family protein n=1 Tax=Actinomycetospora termitidis TaxID=3053470 RepID=A0ABT7MFB5_9PSEU|nr:antibiotic biosynthesis monooxygenase family protein [Actinomycetospora sp. Odt1-22]MDL5159361.1 antibiotic biosynthesis monooxygenase family protein [Actinomycetospora sp. Odt1-22]